MHIDPDRSKKTAVAESTTLRATTSTRKAPLSTRQSTTAQRSQRIIQTESPDIFESSLADSGGEPEFFGQGDGNVFAFTVKENLAGTLICSTYNCHFTKS